MVIVILTHNQITNRVQIRIVTKNYLILYSTVIVLIMLAPMTIPLFTVNAVSSSTTNTADLVVSTGIKVTAHRIPASYWDPCFATTCRAGTGPGVSMYFELYDSSGNFVRSGYADEHGHTFTGLNPLKTYYMYPTNCYACHGSTHDVLFEYWGNGNTDVPRAVHVGGQLNAWFSCDNGCSGN